MQNTVLFANNDNVTLSKKGNHKVAISFGLTASHMRSINCFFATFAGSGVLQENLVKHDWLPLICVCDSP